MLRDLRHTLFAQFNQFTQAAKTDPSLALPHLIFVENPEDKATPSTLLALLPILQATGYQDFYEEGLLGADSIQDVLAYFARFQPEYICLKDKMSSLGCDITSQTDVNRYLGLVYKEMSAEQLADESSVIAYFTASLAIANRQPAVAAYQQFFQALAEREFNYKGVDPLQWQPEELEKVFAEHHQCMGEAYLQAAQPVFGRVALAHVEGIQRVMQAAKLTKTVTQETCFFYLHSNPVISELEQRAREGKLDLPFPMHVIDCAAIEQADVIEHIQVTIAAYQQEQALRTGYRAIVRECFSRGYSPEEREHQPTTNLSFHCRK